MLCLCPCWGDSSGPPGTAPLNEPLDIHFRQTPESSEMSERQLGSGVRAPGPASGLLRVRGFDLESRSVHTVPFFSFFFFNDLPSPPLKSQDVRHLGQGPDSEMINVWY